MPISKKCTKKILKKVREETYTAREEYKTAVKKCRAACDEMQNAREAYKQFTDEKCLLAMLKYLFVLENVPQSEAQCAAQELCSALLSTEYLQKEFHNIRNKETQ